MLAYEWDAEKALQNALQHGVSFKEVEFFEWQNARTIVDDRVDYGEPRFASLGLIGKRVHVLIWTPRGDVRRLISLRKANYREVRAYYEHDH